MSLSRRKMLSSIVGFSPLVLGSVPVLAQEEKGPSCLALDSVDGWRLLSRARKSSNGAFRFSKSMRPPVSRFAAQYQGQAIKFGSASSKPSVTFADESDRIKMTIILPKGSLNGVKLDDSFLIGRAVTAKMKIDGNEIGTISSLKRFSHSFTVPDWMLRQIRTGTTMDIAVEVDRLPFSFFSARIAGFDPALKELRLSSRLHRAQVRVAGKCETSSACVMTSAAVGILGRADDCFELTQMRRLRAHFPEQSHIVDAYIAASNQILAKPDSLWRKSCVLGFYGLFVLPTAFLTWIGAFHMARSTYLFGFGILKKLLSVSDA